MMQRKKTRLAMIVSHPIQYYVPLYRRLLQREHLELKVFFTWHANPSQYDPGFRRDVSWDIPLTSGYDYEVLSNVARHPGSDHFWGIRNPELVRRILNWKPDAVHITGYAYASHLNAMRTFCRKGVPVLFRGDSHLLNRKSGLRSSLRRRVLNQIYKWPSLCLYVGKHNHDYFRDAGVPESRLTYCPHSIEVKRFAEPNQELEKKAEDWRRKLDIPEETRTLLFAAKFQWEKRPIELMKAVSQMNDVVLIMVGNGEFESDVKAFAAKSPQRFRIVPFQNQSLMPVVYRLGDVFVLPSISETWGLGVVEALACGRRVLISDRVGCAPDVVTSNEIGSVFKSFESFDFERKLRSLFDEPSNSEAANKAALSFDVSVTEQTLIEALERTMSQKLN
jgi:glycosyltransferase involved in cell wall biosynthesis